MYRLNILSIHLHKVWAYISHTIGNTIIAIFRNGTVIKVKHVQIILHFSCTQTRILLLILLKNIFF